MLAYLIIIAAALTAWLFLLLPSIIYLCKPWQIKFSNLLAVFHDDALKFYFERFFPAEPMPRDNELKNKFKQSCNVNFGRRLYYIPLALLGIISALGLVMVTANLLYWVDNPSSGFKDPFPPIAISAFLGAYMWVANDQLQSFRKLDFSSHDVYVCSFRFLIALPMGFSFSAMLNDSAGVPIAFFLGTFPTSTLFKYGKRFVNQKIGIGEEPAEGKSELEQVQCINRTEAERFQSEGISNICQLAYSNPVDLTLRTNFDWNYIVDCISQALLWLYVEKDIAKLRLLGLRGAQEVHYLVKCFDCDDLKQKEIAKNCLKATANALGLSDTDLMYTLNNVTEDPYTKFICNVWCVRQEYEPDQE